MGLLHWLWVQNQVPYMVPKERDRLLQWCFSKWMPKASHYQQCPKWPVYLMIWGPPCCEPPNWSKAWLTIQLLLAPRHGCGNKIYNDAGWTHSHSNCRCTHPKPNKFSLAIMPKNQLEHVECWKQIYIYIYILYHFILHFLLRFRPCPVALLRYHWPPPPGSPQSGYVRGLGVFTRPAGPAGPRNHRFREFSHGLMGINQISLISIFSDVLFFRWVSYN